MICCSSVGRSTLALVLFPDQSCVRDVEEARGLVAGLAPSIRLIICVAGVVAVHRLRCLDDHETPSSSELCVKF